MSEKEKIERPGGCFAWIVRVKQSVNERWAKARNSLRKQLARRSGRPLKTGDLLNDTGCPDLIIEKIAKSPVPAERKGLVENTVTETSGHGEKVDVEPDRDETITTRPGVSGHITAEPDGEPSQGQVRSYILGIIANAQTKLDADSTGQSTVKHGIQEDTVSGQSITSRVASEMAMAAVNSSLTNIMKYIESDNKVKDTTSLSSGEISLLADAAVTESLTRIVETVDGEKGASRRSSARTVTEVLEHMDIDPAIGLDIQDDLPPCVP